MASSFDKIRNRNESNTSNATISSFDAVRNRSIAPVTQQEPVQIESQSSKSTREFIENIDPSKRLQASPNKPVEVPQVTIPAITKVKEQADRLKAANEASTRTVMKAQKEEEAADKKWREDTYKSEPPIIRDVHKGLDKFAEATKPFADVAQELYTPGAGVSVLNAATQGASSLVGKVGPALAKVLGLRGGRIAQTALTEAIVGAPVGAGNVVARDPEASNKEILEGAAYGAGGSAVIGAAGAGIVEGLDAGARAVLKRLLDNGMDQEKAIETVMRTHEPVPVKPLTEEAEQVLKSSPPPASASPLYKVGNEAIPTSADGTELSGATKIEDIQSKDGVNYYRFEGSITYMPENQVKVSDTHAQPKSGPMQTTEPTNLDELLKVRGFTESTPDNIANVYNNKNWYHGTGTDKLTAENLDPFVGSHESLFGQGVYLTDDPKIAHGYAGSRGKRTGTPTVYESNVNVDKVLDLEKPPTPDVQKVLLKSVQSFDHAYNNQFEEVGHFSKLVQDEINKGSTAEEIIQKIRKGVGDFSHEAGISTNEFVEDFQYLATNFKEAGYDGLTHTGGLRTGKDPHRVLILLDPRGQYSNVPSRPNQVTKFNKYEAPVTRPSKVEPAKPDVAPETPPVEPRKGMEPMGIRSGGDKGGKFTNPEDTRTYIATKTDREPIDIPATVNKFYEKTVDNLQRLNQFDKYVDSTGAKLSPEDRAYYLALNSRGADVISKTILTEQMVNAKGDVIGKSLKDITKQIPERSYKNFTDYLIAKHAETRMTRGEKVYDKRTKMTVEKVVQKISDYERTYPEFEQISKQLYEWNDKLGKAWLVDTGIIPESMWGAWKEANPFWVPNKRQFSKLEQAGKALGGAKRGFGNQNNPVKKYSPEGSERPIIDPFESLIEYADKYVKTAKRNEVMQSVIRSLEKDPEALDGFATILKRDQVPAESIMSEDGVGALIDSMDDEFSQLLKKSDLEKGNVISGLVDGERVYMRVNDPAMLEALVNLNPQASVAILEMARKATNIVKVLTTGVNPLFALTRNVFRDIPQAYIASKTTNNPIRFGWDLLDGMVSAFGNRDLYKRYKALGGGHSSPVAADRNLLAQSKRELLPQNKRGLGLIPRAYNALENLSNIVEAGPRLGEFKRATKAGGDSYASRVKGLYEANDITVNFKKQGNVTKQADAIFLYLNAAVQGLDKTVRIFKDNPKAAITKSLFAVTVPTVALYALNHNNKDYQNLSNYVKDNFFLIPKGDGTFWKIPKSREIGVPFGSIVERAMREWIDKDPESFRDFSDTVSVAFAPPGVPAKELASGDFMGAAVAPLRDTIGGPLVDVASNENFTGAPIVPGYLEGMSPRNQFDVGSSEVSKKIGDILNVSPKQLDHLIRSYTGVAGQIGLPATTKGATIKDTLVKQVSSDAVFSNDASRYFYELKNELDMQYKDIRATGDVPKGYDDGARKYLGKVADDLGDISKALRAVDDMELSVAEKKDMKRELTDLRNEMARSAYKAVKGYE